MLLLIDIRDCLTPLNFGQSQKFEVKLLILGGIFWGIFLGSILFVGDQVIVRLFCFFFRLL